MSTPESIKKHSAHFKNSSWRTYSYEELANWIHLLTKRATHRTNSKKIEKDLYDAQNYLNMMQSKLDEFKEKIREE